MAFINGKDRLLYIKQGTVWLPVGCLTSNSFQESSEMLGTTTRDNTNGWTSSVPTTQTYSISFDGVLTDDLTSNTVATYYELQTLKRDRTLIEWRIESVEGGYEYGSGYISELGNTNDVGSYVTFNGVIQGFGLPLEELTEYLLLETGDYILLETGDKIIL